VFISYDLKHVSKKAPTPTTVGLIKVKSCNVLLRMLLGCIRSYLKSFLRYKFLILDIYHPDSRSPVAARSKAWVFGRPLAGIVGLNPAVGMGVCLCTLLCVVRWRSLRRADY